jgi:hypothetical protein
MAAPFPRLIAAKGRPKPECYVKLRLKFIENKTIVDKIQRIYYGKVYGN